MRGSSCAVYQYPLDVLGRDSSGFDVNPNDRVLLDLQRPSAAALVATESFRAFPSSP